MLEKIITSLSKDEIRNLKLFLNRTNEREKRKDIFLLDAIRKETVSENEVCEKLYDGVRNPYYRLKNRLKEDLGKSLLVQHYKSSAEHEILHHYLLSKLFAGKRKYGIAEHYLGLAERKAEKGYHYELLELIYSEQLRLMQETITSNPETVIAKRKKNRKKLIQLNEIDDLLSVLTYRLKTSQNYGMKSDYITELLSQAISDYSSPETLQQNPAIRFKIYQGVSKILLQQQDYHSLQEYLVITYKSFSEDQLFGKQNHETKLKMLIYLSNALFKNEQHEQSLYYAEELLGAMREYNYLLYDKYLFYYYNSLFYNYSVIDSNKAYKILKEAAQEEAIIAEPLNIAFITLQLAVYYFQQEQFKLARTEIQKLQESDRFSKLDINFQQKINILELMIIMELQDFDEVDRELGRKKWKDTNNQLPERDQLALDIIRLLVVSRNENENKALSNDIQQMKQTDGSNDLVNYVNWIEKRI